MKKQPIDKPKKSFFNIFRDDNEWNEKSIVGFIAFVIMCAVFVFDVIYAYNTKETLTINDYIFNAFAAIVLGSFAISGGEKVFISRRGKKFKAQEDEEEDEQTD